MGTGSGYYWPFSYSGWIGGPPPSLGEFPHAPGPETFGRPPPHDWKEVVVRRDLASGISVAAERWGLVRFDFAGWAPGLTARSDEDDPGDFDESVRAVTMRLKVMNAQLSTMHTAFIENRNLGTETARLYPRDLIHFDGLGEDGSMGGPGLMRIPILIGPRDSMRSPMNATAEIMELSLDLLDAVLTSPNDDALDYCDLLNQSHVAYQEHDYATSVTGSWTVCERLLNETWSRYVEARDETLSVDDVEVKRVNSDRRRKLLRDFTISDVMEILELAGHLDHAQFRRLNGVRQARNDWLHDGTPPTHAVALAGLQASTDLLADEIGVRLRLSGGRSIAGV